VSKEAVRKCLAEVSRQHPESRPSRGTLKQVFNFLFAGDGGGGGGGGGGEE
jgi:tRNA A64-2'-O-ribosylphosphate transferase